MRCVVLTESLLALSADDAADALAALVRRAVSTGDDAWLGAVESLSAMLGDPELLPYKARASLYAAAKRRGYHDISRLFFEVSPSSMGEAELAKRMAPERPVRPRGRPLTLGERKSLARSHRRELLQHLLRDPHPDVVEILLGNPHLTERDVLSIASRRPAVPDALARVALSERWGARYPVKIALVKNPYTPLPLALRLATTLRRTDLRAVAGDPRLPQPLRDHAASLLDPT